MYTEFEKEKSNDTTIAFLISDINKDNKKANLFDKKGFIQKGKKKNYSLGDKFSNSTKRIE